MLVSDSEPDGGAFDDLYRQLRPPLMRLAYLITGSAAEAEDVVQEALAAYWRRRSSVEHPRAYLQRAVVRSSVKVARKRRRDREPQESTTESLDGSDGAEDRALWECVERLPPRQRAVIVMRYYLDLPHDEIAHAIGIPVATVRTRVHRALGALRIQLDDKS